jgi:hypothetical protein
MNKSLVGLGITALVLSVASASGQQLGTVEQARAMLDRAISALKPMKLRHLMNSMIQITSNFTSATSTFSATTRLMEKLRRMKVLRY